MEPVMETHFPFLSPEMGPNPKAKSCVQVDSGKEEVVKGTKLENLRHEDAQNMETKKLLNSRKRCREEELQLDAKRVKLESSFQCDTTLVDSALCRAAEIILVLAGMSQMRAGRNPTSVEMELMKEAQHTLGSLVSKVNPQDLMSNQLAESLIAEIKSRKDLEQKKELAAKKAEEEKKITDSKSDPPIKGPIASLIDDQSLGNSDQIMLENDGISLRNTQEGAPLNLGRELDAWGMLPVHSSKSSAEDIQHLPRGGEVISDSQMQRTAIGLITHNSELSDGKDFDDSQNFKEGSASPHYHSASMEGMKSNHHLSESRASLTIHSKLVEIVQRLIPPSLASTATAVSNSYIASPVPCIICYLVAKDEASVLICDVCERAFHLKCLQPLYLKDIPEGDWVCPKCVVESGGQSQLQKYGFFRKSFTSQDSTRQGTGTQAGSKRRRPKSQARSSVSQGGRISSGAISHSPPDSVSGVHLHSSVDMLQNKVQEKKIESTPDESLCVQNALQLEDNTQVMNGDLKGEDGNKQHQPIFLLERGEAGDEEAGKDCLHNQTGENKLSCVLFESSTIQCRLSNSSTQSLIAAHGVMSSSTQSLEAAHGDLASSTQSLEAAQGDPAGKAAVSISADNDTASNKLLPNATSVEWAGDMLQLIEEKAYYAACRVGGYTFKLNDCAFFRREKSDLPPYVARIQVLWEDLATESKWARVSWCFYPCDIPALPGCPEKSEENEVYESNYRDNNLVGSIQGPCKVLLPQFFSAEKEKRMKLQRSGVSTSNLEPIFLCRWMYDTTKNAFRKYFGQ